MTKNLCIDEMRNVCQQKVYDQNGNLILAGHWYNRFLFRYISIYITRIVILLGASASQVTICMLFSGLIGVVLASVHVLFANVCGVVLLYAFDVLDCVDGEVARWTKSSSMKGVYLDSVAHVFFNHAAKVILPIHLFLLREDCTYLAMAFAIYVLSITDQSLRKTYMRLIERYESNDHESISKVALERSIRSRRIVILVKILNEQFSIKTISFIAILFTYLNAGVSVSYLCWLLIALSVIAIIIRLLIDYRYGIPDKSHEKLAS